MITTWTFLLVPFLSLMFQLQPVKFSREFATAATVYLALNMLVRGRGGGGAGRQQQLASSLSCHGRCLCSRI